MVLQKCGPIDDALLDFGHGRIVDTIILLDSICMIKA